VLAAEGDWQGRLASAVGNASGAVQDTASAVQQAVAGKLMVPALMSVLIPADSLHVQVPCITSLSITGMHDQ